MTVIADDYVPIKPYTTKTVFLGGGTNISLHAVSFLWLKCVRLANAQM